MKKLSFIAVILIFGFVSAFSQPCLPEGITFNTQAQIDNFQINHPNCTEIEGDVEISGDDITNLNGLNVLTSIGGWLYVMENDFLTSLTGLDNLTSIGGWIRIEESASLTSLTGLDSIDAGSITNLYICDNESLSACEVQSVCDYLANPNGTIEIHDNAMGCNSQAEVETACENASVDELSQSNKLSIYPNPSSYQITIETPITPNKNTFLTIYNQCSQQLITRPITEPKTEIDISSLPAGIYIVKVQSKKEVITRKLVVN